MRPNDVEKEIEKLKLKRVTLTNRINMTTSFDDKEDLKQDLARITSQIDLLEKMKSK